MVSERNKAVIVRLTEKEKMHLKKQAEITGLKVEPFIRKLIMGADLYPRPPDEFYVLLREINAIGNNINQIAHIANAEKSISYDKIKYLTELLDEIMEKVRDLE